MLRTGTLIGALLTSFLWLSPLEAAPSRLVSEPFAAQYGLTRSWFTQVQLDQGRGRIADMLLYDGILYVQTNRAVVQAIDAETGRTLWWKQVGNPQHPSMPLDADRDLLAIINGSRLFILNRLHGDLLYEKELDDAPGAGPALSVKRVYVPTLSGKIIAYALESVERPAGENNGVSADNPPTAEEIAQAEIDRRNQLTLNQSPKPPLFCQSYGKAMVQPVVIRETAKEETVVWPSDKGYLNVASIDRSAEKALMLKQRLETGTAIIGRPVYQPPDANVEGDVGAVVAVSSGGCVHAFETKKGLPLWRLPLGESVIEPPAVIQDRIYVATELGGLHCLDLKTGKELWVAPKIERFLAAGKDRLYTVDSRGRVVVLDAADGATLATIPLENIPWKWMNTRTDRIYLADDSGLLQCLHETDLKEPIVYAKNRKEVEASEEEPQDAGEQMKAAAAGDDAAAQDANALKRAQPKKAAAPKKPAKKPTPKKQEDDFGADAENADADNPLMQQDADPFGAGDAKPAKGAKKKKNTKKDPFGGF